MARRREKLDQVDAEQISRVTAMRGWQLIEQRIQKTLEQKVGELEQPQDEVKTSHLRGFIAGLRLALTVPNILRTEAKKADADGTD